MIDKLREFEEKIKKLREDHERKLRNIRRAEIAGNVFIVVILFLPLIWIVGAWIFK